MAIEDSGFGVSSISLKDNSIRTVTAATTLSILPSLHAVFSSDGEDNVIREEPSFEDVLTNYGDDFLDSNKYGQQNLNVQQVFEGGGTAYICRLLPKNAKTAHLAFMVGVKAVSDIPLYKRDVYGEFLRDSNGDKIPLTVKQTQTVNVLNPDTGVEEPTVQEVDVPATTSGIKFKIMLESANSDLYERYPDPKALSRYYEKHLTETDGENYTVFPFFFMYYYANGKCGKNYGIRIINDIKRDAKVGDGRRYQLFLNKKTSNGASPLGIANGLSFSFNPYAVVSKNSNSIEGLQKIYQNYSGSKRKQIQIDFFQNNYASFSEKITEILQNEIITTEGLDPDYQLRIPETVEDIDFINGTDKDGYYYDNVVIDEESVDMSKVQFMDGGDDGDFETATAAETETIRNTLLKEFFNAEIDTAKIMDVLKCDAGIMYDANYDMDVKKSMASLINFRRDMCCVFDCGFTDNLEEAVGVAKTIQSFASSMDGGENFAIVPHCGITADRTVNVRVTGTYEFAYGLHRLYRLSPFSIYAGEQNGDAGCVRKTIFDWVVEESKPKGYQEKIAKQNKLYWAVDLGKAISTPVAGNVTERNVYFFSNASLYGEQISKLAEFRNGILTNDIRRVLKLILVKYTFDNDGADAAIEKATSEIVKKFATRYPSNIQISVNLYQTERDKLINTATCEVTVIFPDIFETWTAIINVDRAE